MEIKYGNRIAYTSKTIIWFGECLCVNFSSGLELPHWQTNKETTDKCTASVRTQGLLEGFDTKLEIIQII